MVDRIQNSLSRHPYRTVLVLSMAAVITGGMIYILFRPSKYLFFNWIDEFRLGKWLDATRSNPVTQELILPQWIIYSLPNGLWAFAYALIITKIWHNSESWLKYLWMASIPVLVLGFEILQFYHMISGTFCMEDMATGIIGSILGIIISIKISKPKNHEKKT